MKVMITLEPYAEYADKKDPTGVTEDTYLALTDLLGQIASDWSIEREDDNE